jgi:hypothetical protein
VLIEIDRSKEFRVGSTCYLDFRITGTGVWRRMEVTVQVAAGIGHRDEEHEFQISIDEHEPSATHSWRFVPDVPGEQRIRSLRVAVQNRDDLLRVAFVRMRREALSFHVAPAQSAEGSRITIQGNVYGSLVGRDPPGAAAATSSGYADQLLKWAQLPLVEDRDGGWWAARTAEVARVSGSALVRWSSAGIERTLFIVPGDVARIGRRKEDCDVVTRWLPCRSAALDPENWDRNREISRAQLRIFVSPAGISIAPEPDVSSSTHLEKDGESQRLAERTRVSTGQTRVRLGAPGGTPRAGLLLVIAPVVQDGHVVAALVTRPENVAEHAYLVLSSRCRLGRGGLALDGLPDAVEIVPLGHGLALRAPASHTAAGRALGFRELSPDDFTRYPS